MYAGGMTHRQSYPIRSRSSEEFITVSNSPPDDRKKSHTSTQSTTIDTPPKSPPHYGNTLTVDPPELSEVISGFVDHPEINRSQQIVHRESEEFEVDDIDQVINSFKQEEDREKEENKMNGNPGKPDNLGRPGTPVNRIPKNSVRFVKPTLTVTLNAEDGNRVNEAFDEDEREDESENLGQGNNRDKPSQDGTKHPRRRAILSPGYSSGTDLQSQRT